MNHKPDLRCVGGTQVPGSTAGSRDATPDVSMNAALPAALKKAHRAGLEVLLQLLGELFEKADDAFFDYAQKAGSTQKQEEFIETMRTLRLKRKEIERAIIQHVNQQLQQLQDSRAAGARQDQDSFSLESLSLVANDDLEMDVAIEGMSSKARSACAESLYQLNMRLDLLVTSQTVNDQNNPLNPRHVCEGFKKASKLVECDIKSRLIIFKLFDKFVMSHYDEVLDAANGCLAEAGILPDLKGTPRKRTERAASAAKAADSEAGKNSAREVVKEAATEFFGQLQSLLASARNIPMVTDVVGGMSGVGAPIGSNAANARAVSDAELVDILSRLQVGQGQPQEFTGGRIQVQKIDLRNTVNNALLQRERDHGPEKVTETDADVINLVAMLFDFILDDDNLPVPVKALVGRLQIPLLKVAIKDKAFFNRGGHPARKLLNELARAGIGLSEDSDQLQKDMVFKKIQATVQRILSDFNDDMALFDELLNDFSQFMQTEVRRSQMIEQRTRAAEEGKAKTELAEKTALEMVSRRIEGRNVPAVVVRLLSTGWVGVLKLIYLKYGPESTNWQGAVKTIDHLLLSVTPPASDAERKKLFNVVPVLLKNLRQGLNTISFNPFEMGEMFAELEQVQMQILRGETPEHVEDKTPDPARALVAAVTEDMQRMGAAPVVTPRKAPVTQLDITRPKEEPQYAPLPDSDPFLEKAKQLNVGAWFEFRNDNGLKTRAKLAAHIKSADKLIFVNRTGVKIDEKSTLGVAHALKNGEVSLIEDSQLFDRALENVIGNLRKVRQANL